MIILAAIIGKKYNAPEVRDKIGEIVQKIKQAADGQKQLSPEEKQSALTKELETNLNQIEEALKEIAKSRNGAGNAANKESEESAVSKGAMANLIAGILGKNDENPEKAAEAAVSRAQDIIDELKGVQIQTSRAAHEACGEK